MGGKLVLITNRKSHMGFRLVPKLVTLNDRVIDIILRYFGGYFAEFGSFRGQLCKCGCLAINRLLPEKCHKVHQLSTMDTLCSLR